MNIKKATIDSVWNLSRRMLLVGGSVAIIQMNGSVTDWIDDEKNDWKPDPTIGKVLCWCNENNFEVVHCLNTWSYVDKHPRNLKCLTNDVLNNSRNDEWISEICPSVDKVIIAHGNCKELIV